MTKDEATEAPGAGEVPAPDDPAIHAATSAGEPAPDFVTPDAGGSPVTGGGPVLGGDPVPGGDPVTGGDPVPPPPVFTAPSPSYTPPPLDSPPLPGAGVLEAAGEHASGAAAALSGRTQRPEVAIGASFAGGLVVAMLLKRLGS